MTQNIKNTMEAELGTEPDKVKVICAWCDQGRSTEKGLSHGICQEHLQIMEEEIQAANRDRIHIW